MMITRIRRLALIVALTLLPLTGAFAEPAPRALAYPRTWCNPMDLDYAFAPRRDAKTENSAHRSTADPVCVRYRDQYFLVSTNQEGYWLSDDLASWRFVAHAFKPNGNSDQVCAPAAWPSSKGLLFLPSFADKDEMPLYLSTDPAAGLWREVVASFPIKTWDPSLFEDRDGRLYLYWGSSNLYPLRGVELDRDTYAPIGKPVDLLYLAPRTHGWEQFGEDNQHGTMNPFIEGAWMNRFGDRYYLQYSAPGTEWNVYGDGVYVGDRPLGPFVYQTHNPFCWKPTGFIRGAGHGSTFTDRHGNIWHVASMVVSVKHKFERRLGMFPAGVDHGGVLFCDTAFGDYPHRIPTAKRDARGTFTGWMLLSYGKKTWASGSKPEHAPALAVDENIKTYWSAPDGAAGQWFAVDLSGPREVRALQVNFAEEQADAYWKQHGASHRYRIEMSDDGHAWTTLVDNGESKQEAPHAYIELSSPVRARMLRVVNVAMPTGCFALSDFRVFGRASGAVPLPVSSVGAVRDRADRRNVTISWPAVDGAYAYEVSMGVEPGKLYTSFLVYGATRYDLHALDTRSPYWFRVRAVGETGVSPGSPLTCVE